MLLKNSSVWAYCCKLGCTRGTASLNADMHLVERYTVADKRLVYFPSQSRCMMRNDKAGTVSLDSIQHMRALPE